MVMECNRRNSRQRDVELAPCVWAHPGAERWKRVGLGFVAAPRGEVGGAADRSVAGMNAIAFARNFPPPLAKSRGQKCELLERLGLLILAVSSLISDFQKIFLFPPDPNQF
jgi:hypothetical protein